ncbi:hypothetical protein GQ600_26687 [Phytophthora cactorum]|nr:hypothetical protein GQ600_26687 [Phytophthora cactorum]
MSERSSNDGGRTSGAGVKEARMMLELRAQPDPRLLLRHRCESRRTGVRGRSRAKMREIFSSSSPSHAIDFFTEITLPALRTARDGINSNVVVWGIHPTQKYRLLFGKSVGGGGFGPQAEMAVNDVVELYGQLVGILHAFFSQLDVGSRRLQVAESEPWRLGISSWIIVNSQRLTY